MENFISSDMYIVCMYMIQVALSLMKKFEKEILKKDTFTELMHFISNVPQNQPHVWLNEVLQDAFNSPDLETDLASFSNEYFAVEKLQNAFDSDVMFLSSSEKGTEVQFFKEVIKHVGVISAAIIKLEKVTSQLKEQLEHQTAILNRLVSFITQLTA